MSVGVFSYILPLYNHSILPTCQYKKRYGRHKGHDVDVATNPVCFVPQTVAFLKRPISDSGLSESDHAFNAFGVFFSQYSQQKHCQSRHLKSGQ